jgi:hypothetical protein
MKAAEKFVPFLGYCSTSTPKAEQGASLFFRNKSLESSSDFFINLQNSHPYISKLVKEEKIIYGLYDQAYLLVKTVDLSKNCFLFLGLAFGC